MGINVTMKLYENILDIELMNSCVPLGISFSRQPSLVSSRMEAMAEERRLRFRFREIQCLCSFVQV